MIHPFLFVGMIDDVERRRRARPLAELELAGESCRGFPDLKLYVSKNRIVAFMFVFKYILSTIYKRLTANNED